MEKENEKTESVKFNYYRKIEKAKFSIRVDIKNSLVSAGLIERELSKFVTAILNPHIDEAVRLGILKPLIENQPPK